MQALRALLLIPLLPVLLVTLVADGLCVIVMPDWSSAGLTRSLFTRSILNAIFGSQ